MIEQHDINYEAMEKDVDDDGLVDPVCADEDGLGVETRYARLVSSRATMGWVGFAGDYEDCYMEIRVPWSVIEALVKAREAETARLRAKGSTT